MVNRVLSATLLAAAILGFGAAYGDTTTGLVASYNFNNNTLDGSGNGNDGSPAGGFAYSYDRFLNPNAAGLFNGTNSYVFVPWAQTLSAPDTACTQAAWINMSGNSLVGEAYNPIIMKSTNGTNAFMYRMLASDIGFGSAFNNWTTHYSYLTPLSLHTWYHLATVFDGSTLVLYLNGAPVDTASMSLTIVQDTRDLTIGADFPGSLEIMNGRLDDVRIYSRALTASDVAELMSLVDVTAVEGGQVTPGLILGPSHPNPMTGIRTTVDFSLESPQTVRFWVLDASGRLVRTGFPEMLPAGVHSAGWDGRDDAGRTMPSGTYFLRILAGSRETSRRVVRIR